MTVAEVTQTTTWQACEVDDEFADIIATQWPKLTGRQSPLTATFQLGDWSHGDKANTLGERIKRALFPWQAWSMRHIMAKRPDGSWVHPECCLIVPRQNGKSQILAVMVIYRVFILGENVVFTAHQWETAKALWERTHNIVKSRQSLMRQLASTPTCSQGRGRIKLSNGGQVVFTTRSKDAGRGLDRVDLEIYDEAYDLTVEDMAALSPTKMAAADPQTIYTSSAVNGESHPNGGVLSSVRERGIAGEEGLFFAEWMDADGEPGDPETWRLANPSYGMIQTEKKLRPEWRKFAGTSEGLQSFGVEYLGRGVWPTDMAVEEPIVERERWESLASPDASPTGASCLAIDCEAVSDHSKRRDRLWSIVAAVRTKAGSHVQVGFHGTGTAREIAQRVAKVVPLNDPVAVVLDARSIARDLLEKELRDLDIEPEFVSSTQVSESTNGFLQAVDDGAVSHDGDGVLWQALEVAKLRDVGDTGGVAWARKKSGVICQLVAASNALWGLDEFDTPSTPPAPPPVHIPSLDSSRPQSLTSDLLTAGF